MGQPQPAAGVAAASDNLHLADSRLEAPCGVSFRAAQNMQPPCFHFVPTLAAGAAALDQGPEPHAMVN